MAGKGERGSERDKVHMHGVAGVGLRLHRSSAGLNMHKIVDWFVTLIEIVLKPAYLTAIFQSEVLIKPTLQIQYSIL